MVQNVAMEVWIFMPVGGRSSPGRDISLVKKKEKIYKKESRKHPFQQSGKVSHEWLMHDGKNNMMLYKWCCEHLLGTNQVTALVISQLQVL